MQEGAPRGRRERGGPTTVERNTTTQEGSMVGGGAEGEEGEHRGGSGERGDPAEDVGSVARGDGARAVRRGALDKERSAIMRR
jgi:hypothetical protein